MDRPQMLITDNGRVEIHDKAAKETLIVRYDSFRDGWTISRINPGDTVPTELACLDKAPVANDNSK